MTDLFLEMVNRSAAAGYLVLLIAALRLVFRRMPKWVTVALWGLVAFRLLCPVTLESNLSLVPSAQVISGEIMQSPAPSVQTGLSSVNQIVNPVIGEHFTPNPAASANPLQILIPVLSQVWLLGMLLMAGYTAFSYLRLRRRVSTAVKLRENIYQSEAVVSPFILGLLSPRIYLPYSISSEELNYVTAHEQTHLRRRDHWWKPLGFALLSVTWFHPLMWAAYILLCRDIELACDEAAVKEMPPVQRAEYSQTLLSLSIPRRQIAACPLAFGEIGVKERVKRVLTYKKPTFWILLVCLVLCVFLAVTFLTTPSSEGLEILHSLQEKDIMSIQSATVTMEQLDTAYSGATFYGPADQNLGRILPILNQAKGTPIARPWGAKNDADVRFITIFLSTDLWETEGKFLNVEIVADRYLVVGDCWYEADAQWLAMLPPDKGHHQWLTTLQPEFVEKVEFTAEPGSGIQEADVRRLVNFLNRMEIPAMGYPDVLPSVRATYRIRTVDGVTRTLSIRGNKYLMIDDVLYDIGGSIADLTGPWDPLTRLPLPDGVMAAAIRVGEGQRLALICGAEQVDPLLELLNQGQMISEKEENLEARALITLYWNNGDVLNLPISSHGAYFTMGGKTYSYGPFDPNGMVNREQLWQHFGFELPADNYSWEEEVPVYLGNDLFGEAVVMPADTLAVSVRQWQEEDRPQPDRAWALSRQDGRYTLCSIEGTGIRIRYYKKMHLVLEGEKPYYVLTNALLPVSSLSDLGQNDYLLIPG